MTDPRATKPAQKCKKCGKPKADDNYTMCPECDWWYMVDILN